MIISLGLLIFLSGCSTSAKMKRGKVTPTDFHEQIHFQTAKGLMLIPCELEGQTKNYLFDTGAQVTGIQRTVLKGKRVTVRGATNRTVENGTEVLKSFKIRTINFQKTFATNGDMVGLKEQIPNFGGILGRTIIDRANWLIDHPKKEVIISNKDLSDESFTDIPLLDQSSGAPYTMIELDGKTYKAILDLGSIAELNVPEDHPLAKVLMEAYTFEDQARERYTVGGLQSIIQKVGQLPSVKINGREFKDIGVAINKSSQLRIGMNFFKAHMLYVDNLNKKYRVK
ncbi:MAG: hypothetical protein AAF985_05610 [Bacteroidota bacterium]